MMSLPEGTYVLHLDNDGLNNRCENLVLARGSQHPFFAPKVVAARIDEHGNTIYLHNVIMEAMIEEGHPNAIPQDYSEGIEVVYIEEGDDSWEDLLEGEYLEVDSMHC